MKSIPITELDMGIVKEKAFSLKIKSFQIGEPDQNRRYKIGNILFVY